MYRIVSERECVPVAEDASSRPVIPSKLWSPNQAPTVQTPSASFLQKKNFSMLSSDPVYANLKIRAENAER
jgi:hypothetical protein